MSKHTPGPWSFYTEPQPNGCPIVGARGLMVAMLAHSTRHADQHETAIANAHLIAAAPTMYEYIASSASNGCAEVRKIMEAINAGR